MGKYIRGDMDEQLSLGTLAAKTAVKGNFDQTVNERTFVSSVVATWALSEFTKSSGDGPILVGLAHSDYSAAEIEAVIENAGSWNEGDLVAQEVGARKIRRIGIFATPDDEAQTVVLNDGRPIKSKLGWTLLQGQTLAQWAYNLGTSALATTAPTLNTQGHANLWPR